MPCSSSSTSLAVRFTSASGQTSTAVRARSRRRKGSRRSPTCRGSATRCVRRACPTRTWPACSERTGSGGSALFCEQRVDRARKLRDLFGQVLVLLRERRVRLQQLEHL